MPQWTLLLAGLVTAQLTFGLVARAQDATSPDPADAAPAEVAADETTDLFGFSLAQTDRLKVGGVFVAGWSYDGAQGQLGFENQGRVAQATLTVSGRLTDRLRFLVSFNPVNEVSSRPACGEPDFFYPNDPSLYATGPNVPCDPQDGMRRVDTYNTFALDYIVQQGPLREGYVDWRATDALSARFGRFIVPLGFSPLDVGSWTAKDMTRIQRLNAEANFGLMLAYARRNARGEPWFDVALMGVQGEGNREKDYDWFYFSNPTLDANSALTAIGVARVRPHEAVDLRVGYKKGFTGSKVERLPSYWASKRIDDALVVSAKVQPVPWVTLFGEYARYVWGPTRTSAELLGLGALDPIVKPGYYVGGTVTYPLTDTATVGATVTREEVSRDDSLVHYLARTGLHRVQLGKKDRGTVVRVFVDISRLVTAGLFYAAIDNPYPWISGSWPVAGPAAFQGRDPRRYGLMVMVRTP